MSGGITKASRRLVLSHLKMCRDLLPSAMPFEEAEVFLNEYTNFIKDHKLQEAVNSLDDLGLLCNAGNEYWHHLALAALSVGLKDEASRFRNIQQL